MVLKLPDDDLAKGMAIQGYAGSFHQEAAKIFLGDNVNVIPCATFRELVKIAGEPKQSAGAVMAIENSIAGSILPNYNLLQKSNLRIVGEVYLQIRQHLMVNPGVKLEDIKEVHSHPMALLQCTDFLDQRPWKLLETEDTALSAKHVAQHRSKHIAAIASRAAADLYGLDIIAPDIHTLKNNYTRFLVLRREDEAETIVKVDKSSLYFETDHGKGSLAKVLTRIAEGGINLSKLQSFPIPGSQWKYFFHVDMEFESEEQFQEVLLDLRGLTLDLKVYGIYKKGITA
ncbi:MAG TPA: prephenate dehydratase [Dinghuibacter sp.]|uniref:prephenate dehydratase n=1 Tax=Dinghuibacter sp. TaxID=2024697 RepID=UPI002BE41E93|nr:prephenate dehydratase [Dinghuibacter sp.]HTJ13954.1 prephenate dehydratase [Dinghuibacter sp.]